MNHFSLVFAYLLTILLSGENVKRFRCCWRANGHFVQNKCSKPRRHYVGQASAGVCFLWNALWAKLRILGEPNRDYSLLVGLP
jgi:hypothetical protein